MTNYEIRFRPSASDTIESFHQDVIISLIKKANEIGLAGQKVEYIARWDDFQTSELVYKINALPQNAENQETK